MIEIMVVVAIIGLMATVVAINVFPHHDKTKVEKTKVDIEQIHTAVSLWLLENYELPTIHQLITSTDRKAAYLRGYAEPPRDPWGEDYEVRRLEGALRFEVRSGGEDREFDTVDDLSSQMRG